MCLAGPLRSGALGIPDDHGPALHPQSEKSFPKPLDKRHGPMYDVVAMRNARLIREEQPGLSLFDVALATGVNPSTLSKFETGDRPELRYPKLLKLAAFYTGHLGRTVTIDELLAEVVPAPEERQPAPNGSTAP